MSTEREYFEELRDVTFAKALADGFEVVIPTPNQLQLDIDRPWPHELSYLARKPKEIGELIHNKNPRMISVLYRFMEEFKIERHEAWKSANGNIHVVITLLYRELEASHRIALQAMLGSDPMREMLNLRRVLCGADDPIALFKPATSR